MKQFMKRLAGFSLGPILGAAISLILFPIFTNALPIEEYGRAGTFETLIYKFPILYILGWIKRLLANITIWIIKGT